jgi:predicted dehydrogenase
MLKLVKPERQLGVACCTDLLSGIAVIGFGYWGPNWVRNLTELRCAKRLLCCDSRADRREIARRLYPNVEIVDSLEGVLNDNDIKAVVVATPASTHFDIVRQCLAAHKSVLVEKPLATSTGEAAELVKISSSFGQTLMVGHTFEYSASVWKMRELIKSGVLGDVRQLLAVRTNPTSYISARSDSSNQYDVNVLWDLATHDISIALMLLDQMPEAVRCFAQQRRQMDLQHSASLILYFANKCTAIIHVSWLGQRKIRHTKVIGSHKVLDYDGTALNQRICVYDKRSSVSGHHNMHSKSQLSLGHENALIPVTEEQEPLRVECEHFVRCVRTSSRPHTAGINGLRVVSVLEAADRSMKEDGELVLLSPEAEDRECEN